MCKYTNTGTVVLVKVSDMPKMGYIFEKVMVWRPQNNAPQCPICKYTNTTTQIQKYSLGKICR